MKTLSYILAVLWSFFGIRRRAGAVEEFEQLKPVPLVICAFALAGLLVSVLAALAGWAASAP